MKAPILTINRRRILFSHSRWIAIALCLLVGTATARAQGRLVEARVSSVSGRVSLISAARGGPLTIRKGATLAPGDQIDTTLGRRVVIVLTADGGQVIVHPGSRVLLKDFRAAGSARELLEILAGRVRFKIYQLGGRPNPCRVNSPGSIT